MKRTLTYAAIAIFIAGISFGVILIHSTGLRGPHPHEFWVYVAMHWLEDSAVWYGGGSIPANNTQDFMEWYVSQVGEDLEEEWEIIVSGRYLFLDIENKVITDFWGEPIQFIVYSPGKYAFKSFGPNRKDDGGKKDDIIHEWEIKDWVELHECFK